MRGRKMQGDFFADEQARKFADALPQERVQVIAAQQKVAGKRLRPHEAECHVHILLDGKELFQKLFWIGPAALQEQVHGGNGRLDLVCPERIGLGKLEQSRLLLADRCGAAFLQGRQQRLIVCF